MESVTDRIIDRIQRNRISTSEVTDCLAKSGALPNVVALNRGHHRVGRVFWTYAHHESNWDLHEQVRQAPERSIVLTEAFECEDRALYGELVAKYLLLYRQVSAIVACGKLRDAPHLIKENWPIWSIGVTPVGCFNEQNTRPLDPAIIAEHRARYEGAIAVCDDSGAVVVPPAALTEAFLTALDRIEELEDIWFDCVDRRKWDTFDTVCLKRYLKEPR